MYKLIYLLLFTSHGLCQFSMNTAMKADVTFDDDNDRFDLNNLIREQNAMRANAFDPQSSEEYRRMGLSRRKEPKNELTSKLIARSREKLLRQIRKEREVQLNRILNQALLKLHQGRRFDDFAYHDDMVTDGGSENAFDTNLKKINANIKKDKGRLVSRRNLPVEDEKTLMHYAFPINLRVEGYLQTPLE